MKVEWLDSAQVESSASSCCNLKQPKCETWTIWPLRFWRRRAPEAPPSSSIACVQTDDSSGGALPVPKMFIPDLHCLQLIQSLWCVHFSFGLIISLKSVKSDSSCRKESKAEIRHVWNMKSWLQMTWTTLWLIDGKMTSATTLQHSAGMTAAYLLFCSFFLSRS